MHPEVPQPTPPAATARAALPIHAAPFTDLTPWQLHGIIRVRLEVFVVEQDCVYLDLDGRDPEPTTTLLWHELEGDVVSTIRVLHDGDDRIIGRVATLPHARSRGLAAALINEGLARSAGHAVRISAQAHLAPWYAGFGFVVSGEGYLEDGIPHLPMRREVGA